MTNRRKLINYQSSAKLDEALSRFKKNDLVAAKALCTEILLKEPDSVDTIDLLSVVELRSDNLEKALSLIDQALALAPNDAALQHNKGLVLAKLGQHEAIEGRYEEAGKLLERAIAPGQNSADDYINLANAQLQQKLHALAVSNYEIALRSKPDDAEIHFNIGVCYAEINQYEQALLHYKKSIKKNKEFSEAYNNLGIVHSKLKDYDQALENYNKAIVIKPDYFDALLNRATAYGTLNQFDAALKGLNLIIQFQPNHYMAFFNRAIIETTIGQFDNSLSSYEEVIRLKPDYAEAHWNKALLLLLLGDYESGLPLYEWRWKREKAVLTKTPRNFPQQRWNGKSSLKNKKIFVHLEQGLGDMIQFCRYVPLLAAQGAQVILECQKPLYNILKSLNGIDSLIFVDDKNQLPDFDLYIPLMSLPLAYRTTVNSIPAAPRYLSSSIEKLYEWNERLGAKKKLRVGLSWNGNPSHTNDMNRSIPLQALNKLMDVEVEWISLQREIRESDVSTLLNSSCPLRHFGGHLQNLSDTAALCDLMDLVISVDTSIAHLSCALGRPTWILLPFVPDWRWLLNRSTSPWYPTATLYRRGLNEEWDKVLKRLEADLQSYFFANSEGNEDK